MQTTKQNGDILVVIEILNRIHLKTMFNIKIMFYSPVQGRPYIGIDPIPEMPPLPIPYSIRFPSHPSLPIPSHPTPSSPIPPSPSHLANLRKIIVKPALETDEIPSQGTRALHRFKVSILWRYDTVASQTILSNKTFCFMFILVLKFM